MLSNFDIEDICNHLKLPLIGVFSKDLLPKRCSVGSYYVNMENHNDGDGTHWVFIRIFDCGRAIYMDSFGIYAPEDIRQFLKPVSPFAYNTRQIQNIKSENCGRFCILCDYFFQYQLRNKSNTYIFEEFYDWLNSWSENTKINDKICLERFNRLAENT
jgi:hypothetical protein